MHALINAWLAGLCCGCAFISGDTTVAALSAVALPVLAFIEFS